jgi:oxazoline/thiazoline dehydrogenase
MEDPFGMGSQPIWSTGLRLVPRLVESARLVNRQGKRLTIAGSDPPRTLLIEATTDELAEALSRLAGGAPFEELLALVSSAADVEGPPQFRRYVGWLERRGLVEYQCCAAGVELAVLELRRSEPRFVARSHHPEERLVLSRFAYLRRDGRNMVLAAPRSAYRMRLTGAIAGAVVALLASPRARDEAPELLRSEQGAALVELLWRTGFLEPDSEESTARASWEFHDWMFHWWTRGNQCAQPLGATYRFHDRFPSPPAAKAPMSDRPIGLSVPRRRETASSDSFAAVLERRATVREQGTRPITRHRLGLLLYRVGRTKAHHPGPPQELLSRPVPAAGSIHEIEIYLAVSRCSRLDPGLYHYHGANHVLHRLPAPRAPVAALLAEAACAWGKPEEPPQVLVILSARLPRLAWKYEGIAYRLALLDAGVLMEALYLQATALNLACAALGTADAEIFAAATGLDPFAETSIAEFALGSRRVEGRKAR